MNEEDIIKKAFKKKITQRPPPKPEPKQPPPFRPKEKKRFISVEERLKFY